MAGYGIKAFLIAQSLNQIEKAYGANNSILDNCHVRVSFATNDERTAKRVSDALGMATEIRAMKNYAGHRLSPWLGHLMVSRSETARPLLTPGEIMQLSPDDEIVMVSGTRPIRAKKARYYEDAYLMERIMKAEDPPKEPFLVRKEEVWLNTCARPPADSLVTKNSDANKTIKQDDGGHDRQQEFDEGKNLPLKQDIKETQNEFLNYYNDTLPNQEQVINNQMGKIARQTDLDRNNPSNL